MFRTLVTRGVLGDGDDGESPVLPVVGSDMKDLHLVIPVTQEMIESREGPLDPDPFGSSNFTLASRRVIAKAIKSVWPTAKRVTVTHYRIGWHDPTHGARPNFKLPRALFDAHRSMDQGKKGKPFKFVLSRTVPSGLSVPPPVQCNDAETQGAKSEHNVQPVKVKFIKPGSQTAKVFGYVWSCGSAGAIASEIASETGIKNKFVAAQLVGLRRRGLVVCADQRRVNPWGREVIVHVAVEHAG